MLFNGFNLLLVICCVVATSLISIAHKPGVEPNGFLVLIEGTAVGIAVYFMLMLVLGSLLSRFLPIWLRCICGGRLKIRKAGGGYEVLGCKSCDRTYLRSKNLVVQVNEQGEQSVYMDRNESTDWHVVEGSGITIKIPEELLTEIRR